VNGDKPTKEQETPARDWTSAERMGYRESRHDQ